MNTAFTKTALAMLAVGAAAGVGLWICGESTETTWLVVLGGVLLVPGVAAADLGAIKLLQERCPQRAECILLLVAAGGTACLVLAVTTGPSRLALVGALLILPAVLAWFFWPILLLLSGAASLLVVCRNTLCRLLGRK